MVPSFKDRLQAVNPKYETFENLQTLQINMGNLCSLSCAIAAGPQGPAGPTGLTGAAGPQGSAGSTGATGSQTVCPPLPKPIECAPTTETIKTVSSPVTKEACETFLVAAIAKASPTAPVTQTCSVSAGTTVLFSYEKADVKQKYYEEDSARRISHSDNLFQR